MVHAPYPAAGVLLASGLAGPLFLAWTGAAHVYLMLPAPVPASDILGGGALILLVGTFAIPFGFFLSIVPNLLGAALMTWAGDHFAIAREAPIWGVVGAGVGAGIVLLIGGVDTPGEAIAGLAGTGGSCALLCRRYTGWDAGPWGALRASRAA